jgi:L-asparaginase II
MFVKMAEVWRGNVVESIHFGAAAVANARGEIIEGWGDVDTVIYPRSALKPIQAIALMETGAAAALGLQPRHVALACASHHGEPFHIELIQSWLAHLGLGQDALMCGPDLPMDAASAAAVIRGGHSKQRVYHNCSGKHCGFLSVCVHRGWSVEDYDHIDHPSQQLYLDALSEIGAFDARALAFGVDGCTLPAAAMPLRIMAATMARFADARIASSVRRPCISQIHEAMRAYPEYVSGIDAPAVRIARATEGRVVVKTGAEGFIVAYIPEQGLAVALKIADGDPRGRVPVLIALLERTGMISPAERDKLAESARPAILDSRGKQVGRLRACSF